MGVDRLIHPESHLDRSTNGWWATLCPVTVHFVSDRLSSICLIDFRPGVSPGAVVWVDPQTGARTIISDATTGSAPPFQRFGNIEVEATGELVTMDRVRNAVFRIHPVTGARTIVSDATTGRGPAFFAPSEIAVEPTGTLVVADTRLRAVVRVDPISGDRAIIAR